MPYIAISYRDEGHGKGAFYDHLTLRHMTGWNTKVATSNSFPTTKFASYINYREGYGSYGLPLSSDLPEASLNYGKNAAFIFIPGYTRDSDNSQPENHLTRLAFEKEMIRKAKCRGQPILAVCAGSWTLWESFGGAVKPISDHNYGGAMPRIGKSKARICNNKMIHDIDAVEGSFVHRAMFGKTDQKKTAVNSVHWNAVDESTLDAASNVVVSANSNQNNLIAPKSRQSKQMKPENCVEAFETIHGAPMIGIQWHPEAFNPSDDNAAPHKGIFDALKVAGATYKNRQRLNKEFTKVWHKNAYADNVFFKPKPKENQAIILKDAEEELSSLKIDSA